LNQVANSFKREVKHKSFAFTTIESHQCPLQVDFPPYFFSPLKTLSDFNSSPIDEEQELRNAVKKDCVEYCRNCHRNENHYLAWRAFWYYGILLGFSAGLVHLGPYRCRCCGRYLPIRWDLLRPSFYYRWMKGELKEKKTG
jgi:hypothetical protein